MPEMHYRNIKRCIYELSLIIISLSVGSKQSFKCTKPAFAGCNSGLICTIQL